MNNGEIILLSLMVLDLFCTAFLHGNRITDKKHDFFKTAFSVTISFIIYRYAGLFDGLF